MTRPDDAGARWRGRDPQAFLRSTRVSLHLSAADVMYWRNDLF